MARQRKPYERLSERAARGEYELVAPLDYMIIERLMDEGSLMGGIAPLGTTVSDLRSSAPLDQLTSEEISARLRSMANQGLTIKVKISGGKRGVAHAWQRTAAGMGLLSTWKEEQS